jgi:hypothetical protein
MKAFFKYLLWSVLWAALFLWMGFLDYGTAPGFIYIKF